MPMRVSFALGNEVVAPGTRRTVDLAVSTLSDHTPVTMSVHVVHARRPGPTLFVSAAVHGDEVIGVEVARRLLRSPQLDAMKGTLMVIPIVNAFGFLNHSRYLPDRRDLNRSFPGSEAGSLAARLAHLFLNQIVSRADLGIDLHSAAVHRTNLPQIRLSPGKDSTMLYAKAFGAPVIIVSKLREGSLRQVAQSRGVDMLLYEAGEGLRFDELSARAGVAGILRVMHAMGMIARKGLTLPRVASVLSSKSAWERAPAGGLLRSFKATGEVVGHGELLGLVSDPFGQSEVEVRSTHEGVIIGRSNLPVVNEGDALFHIAATDSSRPQIKIGSLTDQLEADPMFDEDEII
jgi:uncharacterized protein